LKKDNRRRKRSFWERAAQGTVTFNLTEVFTQKSQMEMSVQLLGGGFPDPNLM
jgi:hypothetical protein